MTENNDRQVTFSKTTKFKGTLRFKGQLCIQGLFDGTIESEGDLHVDKGAQVKADTIRVNAITVQGNVNADIFAGGKADLKSGAEVHGDLTAGQLRIADGVLFEGRCSMANTNETIEIFSRPIPEIKAEMRHG
jgi:cytoskeletal protein CcmA (bactofilin family)